MIKSFYGEKWLKICQPNHVFDIEGGTEADLGGVIGGRPSAQKFPVYLWVMLIMLLLKHEESGEHAEAFIFNLHHPMETFLDPSLVWTCNLLFSFYLHFCTKNNGYGT